MWSRDVRRRTRKNKVVVLGGQAPQGPLSFFSLPFLLEEKEVGSKGKALGRRPQTAKDPHAQQSAGKGEFSALLKRGETLAGGFPSYAAHHKRRTTQRLFPTLCGSFYWRYGFGNPSVSLVADSSLCTREPWVGALSQALPPSRGMALDLR